MGAKIIVLEGSNGSGKTTQSLMLKKFLERNGFKVKLLKSLQRKNIGEFVREMMIKKEGVYSNETVCIAMASDLMEEIDKEVKGNMEEYDFIVFDRYYYSTFVYQGLRGVRKDWIKELYRYALKPDIVFVLNIGFNDFIERVKKKENVYEKDIEFQKKVIKEYSRIKEILPNEDFVMVDGRKGKDEINKEIVEKIMRL